MRASATIIVDASFCHQTGAAGYGVWVACDRGSKPFKGPLPVPGSSSTAETMAIANALWHAIKEGLVIQDCKVLIQTDCAHAIRVYEEHNWNNEKETSAYKWMLDVVKRHNLVINFRHVKGHSGTQDRRSNAQKYCDERAKEAMRSERARLAGPDIGKKELAVLATANLDQIKSSIAEAKERDRLRSIKAHGERIKETLRKLKNRSDWVNNYDEADYTEADYQTWMNL